MKKILFVGVISFLLLGSACSIKKNHKPDVQLSEIQNERFVFVSLDGNLLFEDISDDEKPFLQLRDDGVLFGRACNTFTGTYVLEKNTLYAQLAMTRMLCDNDDLNILDQTIAESFLHGATVSEDNKQITLSSDSGVLVYELLVK